MRSAASTPGNQAAANINPIRRIRLSILTMPRLRFSPGSGFFVFGRFDLIQILFSKIAVADFSIRRAESWIAGRFRTRAEQNHVLAAGVVELIKLPRGYGDQHPGIERPRRRIGKVKRALDLDAIKLLISGVLVHGTFGSWIVAMHPGMKMIRGA